jgi:DNA segregation ATPase FtsK/SpoIIIE-like protein
MNRRLWLHALSSASICTRFAGAAVAKSAAAQPTLAANLHWIPVQSDGPVTAHDPLYTQAVAVVMTHQEPSICLVQRHLKLGYSRVARMFVSMEHAGIISSKDVHGHRQILVPGCSSTSQVAAAERHRLTHIQ